MGRIKQNMLCGIGGQGIVLAGTMLGRAAFNDGKWVSSTSSYGSAARGGTCRAEVVISDEPIAFPFVIEADVLIAMYQTAHDKYAAQVKREGGIVVYDSKFVSPQKGSGLKYIGIPATRTAVEELNNGAVANVILLGAAVEITGMVTRDALRAAVEETVPDRFRKLDLAAVDLGFGLGRIEARGAA